MDMTNTYGPTATQMSSLCIQDNASLIEQLRRKREDAQRLHEQRSQSMTEDRRSLVELLDTLAWIRHLMSDLKSRGIENP